MPADAAAPVSRCLLWTAGRSVAKGFKSGGFNLSSTEAGRGFAPEWAWSYEAGLKGTWMEGRSRVAAAGFAGRGVAAGAAGGA